MFNKNQDKKKFRHSEFQNSFLHDNQNDEKQHKRPRLDIQFNTRRYGEPGFEQSRGTSIQPINGNPEKAQKSNLVSRSNRLLTTKSLSANAIDSNKGVAHTPSFSNRAGNIYSFNKDTSSKSKSEYLIDFHNEKSNIPRSKTVNTGKTNYLHCTTAVVSSREESGKSLGNSIQNDDIWGEDLDEVTVEECMLLATQASQTCIPEPSAATKTKTEAKALSDSNVTKSFVTVGEKSEFFQQTNKIRKIHNNEIVGVIKELEINNYHHKETVEHETVKQGIVQIQEVQKLSTENSKLKENILTKEGEVSILRTQLNEAKSEIEAQKQEKLKALESLTKEFNDKLKTLEKELQQTKTQLEFKNIEAESLEEQKLLKCKKKVKLVAPEPVVTNSTTSGSFNDRSTFTDSPKRVKKQLRKKGEELKKISQGSRFGYQVSSSLFEKVPKKVQSVTNVCSVNTTPDFSDDKLAYLTPQAVTINAAYTGINQLFLLDSFEDEKGQPLIKWVVWECFKVIICQLALLEAHGTVQSLKHRTLLNKKVLSSAGKFVGNSPSLISPKPWHDMEQGIETRRALGVLSAIASISENAAGYMIGSVEPVESYDLKKWKLQSPIKDEASTSSIPRTFSLEGKTMTFQQMLLYRPGSATEDELFRYHQIASSSSVCQQEVPKHCSKEMTELLRRNANNSKLFQETAVGSTSNTTTYIKSCFLNQEGTGVKILERIGMRNSNTQPTSIMQEQSFSSNRLKTLLAKHSGFKFLPVKNKAFMKQLEMMKEPAFKEHNKKDAVVEKLKSNTSKNKTNEAEPKQHTNEINLDSTNKGEDLLQVLYSLTRCICEQRLSVYFCGVLCAIVVLLKGIASKTHIGQERHALIGMLLKELVFCLPCANVLVEMTALLCWLGRYDLIMKSFCNWTGQANETRRMYDIKTYPKTKCTLQLLSLLLRLRKADIKQYVELADNLTRWLICIGNDATALEPSWISIPAAKPHETPPKICPCRTHIMDATIMLLYTCYEYLQKTGFDKNNNLYHVASRLPGRGMVLLYRLLGKVRDFEVFINKSEGEYELLLKGIEQNAKHLPLNEEEEEAFRWLLEVEADHWSQIPSVPLGDKDGAVSNSVCSFLVSQMS